LKFLPFTLQGSDIIPTIKTKPSASEDYRGVGGGIGGGLGKIYIQIICNTDIIL